MSSISADDAITGTLILDHHSMILSADADFLALTGFTENELVGRDFNSVSKFSSADSIASSMNTKFGHYQQSLKCKDNSDFPAEVFFFKPPEKSKENIIVFVKKISVIELSKASGSIIEQIFENTNEAILITDNQGVIETVNKSFTLITEYSREDVIGKTPAILNSGKQDKFFYKQFWRKLINEGKWQGEIWNKRKNGEIYPEWLNISSIRDQDGHIINYICQFTDITSRKKSEAELKFLAYHDTLTNLPNRHFLFEKLDNLMSLHQDFPLKFAVLFCGLDRFKVINDSLGYEVGDELLRSVATRFNTKLRDNDIIARSGGDEFTVVIEGEKALRNINKICQQIQLLFEKPFQTKFGEFKITVSIGGSEFPNDSVDVKELISFANMTMHNVKDSGGNDYGFFDAKKKLAIKQRLELESEIFQAIEKQQFEVWYQPQINANTSEVYGIECLIRWRHPQHGLIPPDLFIPIAEANGSIKELGYFVLKTACRQLRQWRENQFFTGVMAINVSMRQFERNDFLVQVKQVLQDESIPAKALELEVTESIFAEKNHRHNPILRAARKLGIKVAIDDFGTGYSSLQRLKSLPIDNVKIDKCFVDNIVLSEADTAIISAMILLSKTFQINLIAEGIETQAQADKLCALGCYNQQGYLYSKALNSKEFEHWLTKFKNQHPSKN